MRLPRKYALPEGSIFHLIWRAINGEFFLSSDDVKREFLDRVFRFFNRTQGNVVVFAFAVLSNHFHQAGELLLDSGYLSNWARSAHASFALWLNRRLNRKGPVAQDRFKSLLAQDQAALRRLMFYIDWNPVRAGLCGHPSEYRFSSYRYYAYGEVNDWTRHLTPPPWYIELGETARQRQQEYRRLCDEYYYGEDFVTDSFRRSLETGPAIGGDSFVKWREWLLKAICKVIRRKSMPKDELDSVVRLSLQLERETSRPSIASVRASPIRSDNGEALRECC